MSSYTVDGQTHAADERSDESSQGARVGARHNAREFVQEGVIERQGARFSARGSAANQVFASDQVSSAIKNNPIPTALPIALLVFCFRLV